MHLSIPEAACGVVGTGGNGGGGGLPSRHGMKLKLTPEILFEKRC